MAGPAAPLAIRIAYRPQGTEGEYSTWVDVPAVDGVAQLELARDLAKVLKRQGGWEAVMMLDGTRVE